MELSQIVTSIAGILMTIAISALSYMTSRNQKHIDDQFNVLFKKHDVMAEKQMDHIQAFSDYKVQISEKYALSKDNSASHATLHARVDSLEHNKADKTEIEKVKADVKQVENKLIEVSTKQSACNNCK
jgi:hypothetical protein